MPPGDAHRSRQPARAVGGLRNPLHRFQRSDKHAAGDAFRAGDEVKAFVHPVDQVNVGVARRAENDLRSRREASSGVGGFVFLPQVRFHFDDPRGALTVNQQAAKQVRCDFFRRARIKPPGQYHDFIMRLFVGIGLPAGIAATLDHLIEDLKRHAAARWSPVANLHITTKFIGEWPEARLDEMRAALGTVAKRPPLTIALRGLGWSPNPHSPRIFWVPVAGGEALRDLAADTERAIKPLGVAAEKRAYTPHLTLARVKPETDLRALRQQVAALPTQDWGTFEAREFELYRSQPGAAGSVYTALDRFLL